MRIAIWSGSGIGGTEKAAIALAAGLKRRGHDVDFLGPPGPRTGELEAGGIPVLDACNDPNRLRAYLQNEAPDVVHQYVPGGPLPGHVLYQVWPSVGVRKPALIETNVFGLLTDPVSERLVRFRVFISLTSAAQAFRRVHRTIDAAALMTQTAVLFPTDPPAVLSEDRRNQFRTKLGIQPADVLVIRTGRVSHKWTDWECRAFAAARRRCSGLRLLLMEPPPELANRIRAGTFGDGIIVRPVTDDFGWLRELYSAADVMLHASDWGESFGYTISEGLAAGLPVIVRTTPWGDNAQVELVENARNGFVCASVPEMGRRLADLAQDSQLRRRLGAAARGRMESFAQLEDELDVMEDVLRNVQDGTTGPHMRRRNEELLAYARRFRQREWETSESASSHPLDYATARLYSGYRSLRSAIRIWRERRLSSNHG